jgi:2-alkenal reductase
MGTTFRTAITAAISSLLTLSLVAACDVARPLLGQRAAPTAAPAATSQPSPGAPQAPPLSGPGQAPSAPVVQAAPGSQAATASDAIIRVYRDANPSVVAITSTVIPPGFSNRASPQPVGAGSGFVVDEQGHIVTNNHVVEDADRLEVTLPDGRTIPAKLIGRDPRSDLAVVKVDVPKEQLKIVRLGSSGQVQIGEVAIAIGNPFGLDRTVTAGIVSGRRPVVDEPTSSGPGQRPAEQGLLIDAIQTDASINPGNSGGPLFNGRGEVIGINTLIISGGGQGGAGGNIGIGFAIPIDYAKRIVPELIAKGKYAHPFLGMLSETITETMVRDLNLPVKEGLLVQEVEAGTPAARAGLKGGSRPQDARSRRVSVGGDIITAADGKPMKRAVELVAYLETQKSVGETVTLSIVRDGKPLDLPVQLGERPTR